MPDFDRVYWTNRFLSLESAEDEEKFLDDVDELSDEHQDMVDAIIDNAISLVQKNPDSYGTTEPKMLQ